MSWSPRGDGEAREQEKDELVRQRELKEAARLVDEELRDATDVLRDAIYQARWWPAPRQLSSDVYTRYRRVLAIQLADAAWSEVSLAYQELNEANWTSERGEELANPLVRIDLQSVGISVVRARQALASAAAPPDHVSLLQDSAEGVANALFPVPHEGAEQIEEELKPLMEGNDDENESDLRGEGS